MYTSEYAVQVSGEERVLKIVRKFDRLCTFYVLYALIDFIEFA